MSAATPAPDQSLHLPGLVIKNFRGIDELTIPRLGRVTLIVGENSVGKTTVLDAARAHAARGRTHVLADVLLNRDEVVNAIDEDGDEVTAPDWDALFFGRRTYANAPITIGTDGDADDLQIRMVALAEEAIDQLSLFQSDSFLDEEMLGLEVKFQDSQYTIPTRSLHYMGQFRLRRRIPSRIRQLVEGRELPLEVLCNTLGPDVPSNSTVDQFWDEIALTPHEESAVQALNLIRAISVERVASVGSDTRSRLRSRRRFLAKVEGEDNPVPLRSLGDGAVRIFSIALALASSSNGFLLIDEVENGIHYSIQSKFWKMVIQTAQRNNVQVIATTHSWDCVKGFAEAAAELEEVEGALVRLEKHEGKLRAVEYSERNLKAAAKYGIEVR